MDPYDWLSKFYSFYEATVIGIVSRHGLTIDACRGNQPNKGELAVLNVLIRIRRILLEINRITLLRPI